MKRLRFPVATVAILVGLLTAGCGPADAQVNQDPGASAPGAPKLSQAQIDQIHSHLKIGKKNQ